MINQSDISLSDENTKIMLALQRVLRIIQEEGKNMTVQNARVFFAIAAEPNMPVSHYAASLGIRQPVASTAIGVLGNNQRISKETEVGREFSHVDGLGWVDMRTEGRTKPVFLTPLGRAIARSVCSATATIRR